MNFKSMAFALLMVLALASCRKQTVLPYFTDILTEQEGTLPMVNYTPTIRPDDELFISVSSTNQTATSLYNLLAPNPIARERQQASGMVNNNIQTFIVDSEGYINFPILGRIHVAGYTPEELQKELTNLISKDVKDPIVNVSIVNFTVIVAGEVARPQTLRVNRNRISVLDALAAAGDLTPYGERSNVLVIREEEDGKRVYAHLNLNSSDVLTSPYYYLKQNDYVYVAPNKVRQSNSQYDSTNAFKLQITSTIVSAVSVIASLAIALTR